MSLQNFPISHSQMKLQPAKVQLEQVITPALVTGDRTDHSSPQPLLQVEVLVPFKLSVGEGQSARLPCHFATAGKSAESVQWERESQLVFKQLFKTGEVYGKDFKGRANGSQDAYRRGDMSLTLTGVQPRDQGNYFCKILLRGGVPENGQPGAVRLWVNHSHSVSL